MRGTPDERVLRALLGVDRGASWEQVRRAFREAVRASHPDLHSGDPGAERRLKTLNGLWESINTPGKWAQYVALPTPAPSAGAGANGRRPPEPPPPAPSAARLRVQRQRSGSAGMRRWQLELDGEVVASLANGATCLIDATPGRHSVRVSYDWYASEPLQVVLRLGHELHLGCRQQAGSLRSLTSPKRSLLLEPLGSRRVA